MARTASAIFGVLFLRALAEPVTNSTSGGYGYSLGISDDLSAREAISVSNGDPVSIIRIAHRFLNKRPRHHSKTRTAIQIVSVDEPVESGTSTASNFMWFCFTAVLYTAFAYWYHANGGKESFTGPSFFPEEGEALQKKEGEFRYGFFHCFDVPALLCFSCCCAPARWSDTMSMLGLLTFSMAFIFYITCLGLDAVSLPGTMIFAAIGAYHRQQFRKMIKAPNGDCSSICCDFWAYLCCVPCAITQEAREVEAMKKAGELADQVVGEPVAVPA